MEKYVWGIYMGRGCKEGDKELEEKKVRRKKILKQRKKRIAKKAKSQLII